MTTTVIVDAHAGWPVEFTLIDQYEDGDVTETKHRVEPHTQQDFHVYDTRQMCIRELNRED